MEERLALLKEKMKQSEVNQSGWFYYIGGAILALGLAGLYALYVRKWNTPFRSKFLTHK